MDRLNALSDSLPLKRVEERIVNHLIEFFSSQLPYVNDTSLAGLYASAAAAPHASTKAQLKQTKGIVFNGPFVGALRSGSMLMYAFDGTKPLLAKFNRNHEVSLKYHTVFIINFIFLPLFVLYQSIRHEYNILKDLLKDEPLPRIVGPVSFVSLGPANYITPSDSAAVLVKNVLLMPVYCATLNHIPKPMEESRVLSCGKELKETLELIHKRGYGHNDIKAANIFLDSEGRCILGDFGSAQRLGVHTKESTPTHWPSQHEKGVLSLLETSKAIDFFLLAVTLLERTGCYELNESSPTLLALQEATARLTHKDLQRFVEDLLSQQAL